MWGIDRTIWLSHIRYYNATPAISEYRSLLHYSVYDGMSKDGLTSFTVDFVHKQTTAMCTTLIIFLHRNIQSIANKYESNNLTR